jgi:hypothetical protein
MFFFKNGGNKRPKEQHKKKAKKTKTGTGRKAPKTLPTFTFFPACQDQNCPAPPAAKHRKDKKQIRWKWKKGRWKEGAGGGG